MFNSSKSSQILHWVIYKHWQRDTPINYTPHLINLIWNGKNKNKTEDQRIKCRFCTDRCEETGRNELVSYLRRQRDVGFWEIWRGTPVVVWEVFRERIGSVLRYWASTLDNNASNWMGFYDIIVNNLFGLYIFILLIYLWYYYF